MKILFLLLMLNLSLYSQDKKINLNIEKPITTAIGSSIAIYGFVRTYDTQQEFNTNHLISLTGALIITIPFLFNNDNIFVRGNEIGFKCTINKRNKYKH